MAEKEDKTAERAPDATSAYVLKKGASHSVLRNGSFQTVVGDGHTTVDLTDEQARNFADKLDPDTEIPALGDAPSFRAGEERGGGLTIPEGAARAGEAAGIVSDDAIAGNADVKSGVGDNGASAPQPGGDAAKAASAAGSKEGTAQLPADKAAAGDGGKK